jgi:alcohol dehydrogenase (cytochrome c)
MTSTGIGKLAKFAFVFGSIVGIGAVLAARAPSAHVQAQAPAKNAGAAIFTPTQAAQGKSAYEQSCARCHGQNLDDGEFGTPLKGSVFSQHWGGKSAGELIAYMSTTMPPANPRELGIEANAQILAYILQANGVQPGNRELPADAQALSSMLIPGMAEQAAAGPGGGLSPFAKLPPAPVRANPLDKISPVTDALLQHPPAAEWLNWRRTYDDQGFSPLKQIDRRNVADLQVAWAWSLPSGPNTSTPLVHDGVIFVHGYFDHLQALDAATGELLWHYARQLPKDAHASINRNLSIYNDRLFVQTSDVHVIALDVKTGKVLWDHEVADYKKGIRISGGPLVAKGKVMIGTAGAIPGGNFIVALDVQTGQESWRFNVIARPGETGGDSWNGLPLEKRNGGSVWTAGSYDPELNLAYFGPAQTYDTGPLLHPVNQPGITNDALYTDSTLALNPDTGKLVWYFQHVPNDQWDLDWAFERQLIKLPVNGEIKKLAVTGGKMAIYDAMDAATGRYVFSMDLGLQNVVMAIDSKTGAKTINPNVVPGDGKTKLVCPHPGGGRNWLPTSYNSDTKILYTPMVESCMDLIPVAPGERGSLSSGVRWTIRPRPDSDGQYGRLEAINLETKQVVWITRQHAPQTTGVLATAGGIVFNGSLDRFIRAYDDTNGKVLWEARLNDVPSSCPITYSVNGRQYVAVVVGNGGSHTVTWPPLVPDIRNPPGGGAALWVFELPAKDRAHGNKRP